MRWTKKVGREVAIGLVNIGHVALGTLLKSLQMIMSMVAYAMTALYYHLILIRMLAYIVTHHKKSGFNLVFIQNIEHPRGNLRNGTVIESEIYGPFRCIHPPACTRVHPADELWGLFNKHKVKFMS